MTSQQLREYSICKVTRIFPRSNPSSKPSKTPHNSLVLKMYAQVEGAGSAYPKAAAVGPGVQGCAGQFPSGPTGRGRGQDGPDHGVRSYHRGPQQNQLFQGP